MEDTSLPCQHCTLFKECKEKGNDNQCGMFYAIQKNIFISQCLEYFIYKNPIRYFVFKQYQKYAKIDLEKYKNLTGRDFEFTVDPFPEFGKEIKVVVKNDL